MSCDASLARSDWLLERSFSKRLRASAQSFLRNGICARLKRAFQNFGSIRAASSKASSVFVGATFSAANELSASAATAAIFQILMRVTIEAFLIRDDKSKFPIDSAQFRRN